MKKTIKVLLVLVLFDLSSVFAQNNLSFLSGEQLMVKKTIDSALFIIRQDYVLKDTINGQSFGFNNKPYFGSAYTIGFMVDSLLWFSSDVLKPWANDTNHFRFQRAFGYVPVLSNVYYRNVNEDKYQVLEYHSPDFSAEFDSIINTEKLKVVKPIMSFKGLSRNKVFSSGDGWVVFLHTEMPIKDCDTCNVLMSIYKGKPDFNNRGSMTNQPQVNNIIGGIYVDTQISTGKIEFLITAYNRKVLNWFSKILPEVKFHQVVQSDNGFDGNVIDQLVPIEVDNKSKKSKKRNK
jgi:hypothetical protein